MQQLTLTERTKYNCGHVEVQTLVIDEQPTVGQINRQHFLAIHRECGACRSGEKQPDLTMRGNLCCPKHIWEFSQHLKRYVCVRCLKNTTKKPYMMRNGSK